MVFATLVLTAAACRCDRVCESSRQWDSPWGTTYMELPFDACLILPRPTIRPEYYHRSNALGDTPRKATIIRDIGTSFTPSMQSLHNLRWSSTLIKTPDSRARPADCCCGALRRGRLYAGTRWCTTDPCNTYLRIVLAHRSPCLAPPSARTQQDLPQCVQVPLITLQL